MFSTLTTTDFFVNVSLESTLTYNNFQMGCHEMNPIDFVVGNKMIK